MPCCFSTIASLELVQPLLTHHQVDEQHDRVHGLAFEHLEQGLALVAQQHLRRRQQRTHA